MQSIQIIRRKNYKSVIPLNATGKINNTSTSKNSNKSNKDNDNKPKVKKPDYPYLSIKTLTTDDLENISEINGSYKLSQNSKIRCNINGEHLAGLVNKISIDKLPNDTNRFSKASKDNLDINNPSNPKSLYPQGYSQG